MSDKSPIDLITNQYTRALYPDFVNSVKELMEKIHQLEANKEYLSEDWYSAVDELVSKYEFFSGKFPDTIPANIFPGDGGSFKKGELSSIPVCAGANRVGKSGVLAKLARSYIEAGGKLVYTCPPGTDNRETALKQIYPTQDKFSTAVEHAKRNSSFGAFNPEFLKPQRDSLLIRRENLRNNRVFDIRDINEACVHSDDGQDFFTIRIRGSKSYISHWSRPNFSGEFYEVARFYAFGDLVSKCFFDSPYSKEEIEKHHKFLFNCGKDRKNTSYVEVSFKDLDKAQRPLSLSKRELIVEAYKLT